MPLRPAQWDAPLPAHRRWAVAGALGFCVGGRTVAGGRKGLVGNLPAELTSFVGRRSELGEIKRALSSSRLVTLVGPGGVGKTRLALHSAAASRRAFHDGVWFVDISPLRDEEQLAYTIALALDLHSG